MVATATSDELGLHRRLLSHDIAALAEVYDQYAATVFGVARRVTADRHAAEDVTQNVLVDLWRRPERFHPNAGRCGPGWRPLPITGAWTGSATNRRPEVATEPISNAAWSKQVPDVDGDVQAWMTAQRLRKAVSALPEVEQLAIRLAFFSGLTYRQVAADLDLPEGTIKSRIRSGLRRLSLSLYAEALVSS